MTAGLARARAAGRIGGRPRVPADVEAAVREELAGGSGILKTARLIGVGASVVQRIRAEQQAGQTGKGKAGR